MNEQSIQKQYNQIVSLLEDKRLKEALVQLDAFLYNSNDWTLRNRLEQIQTSYQYMLQYMKLGMKDPERHKLYRQLLADTWEIADQTRILLLDEISTHYYHSLRRNPNQLPKAYDLSAQQRILEGFSDEMAVSQLANYQGLDAILKRHEETHRLCFLPLGATITGLWKNLPRQKICSARKHYQSMIYVCLSVLSHLV